MAGKMHANEVPTSPGLVRRLLAAQMPQWATLPVSEVPSAGTDNALFRLGDELSVRMPRVDWAKGQVEKEFAWLPTLAPHLPLAISTPTAKGEPGEGYPWTWGVYRWLEGEPATPDRIEDPLRAASDLATFLRALHRIDASDGPAAGSHNVGRGLPLATRDAVTRASIPEWDGVLDTEKLTATWEAATAAPQWPGPPVWVHGDLQGGNLLAKDGQLSAVIDWGTLGTGDPACDLVVAWSMFGHEAREVFREAMQPDEASWARARGWAVSRVGVLPYYRETNPVLVEFARQTLEAVLSD